MTAPLLERAGQLAVLERRHAAVSAEGRGHFVLIAGEAGIGKTALVRAFCDGRPRVPACARVHAELAQHGAEAARLGIVERQALLPTSRP